jgi:general stress protein YciG
MHDTDSTTERERDVNEGAPVSAPDAEQPSNVTPKAPRPRGFAAMDRKKVSQIASKGGKAAHRAGTAHEFTSDEARAAGKKGGSAHGKPKTGEGGSGSGSPH